MEVYFLDKNFLQCKIVDTYISLLWVDRYNDCGEFELLLPMADDIANSLVEAKYVEIKDSDETMIIENVELETDVENGDTIKLSGRSLLSILERRVLIQVLAGDVHPLTILYAAYVKNVSMPVDSYRAISNFEPRPILPQLDDVPHATENFDVTGNNILELVISMCSTINAGCKVYRNKRDTVPDRMQFEVYCGKDRSYNQNQNLPVVFSPYFDNLLTSNYLKSDKTLKNACFIRDSGKTGNIKETTAYLNRPDGTPVVPVGLDRKEIFLSIDTEFVSTLPEGATPSQKQEELNTYINELKTKGREELREHRATTMYDGELISSGQNEYGRDYFLGDIVSFRNAYGMESTVRITEVTRSYDASGVTLTPVFTSTEEEE